jgi:hypothetical protein
LTVQLIANGLQHAPATSGLSQMAVDGICCDSKEPVAKLSVIPPEAAKILDNFKKDSRGNIFGRLSFKESVHTIAKHGVMMPAIQLRERRGVAAGLGNQLPSIHFHAVVAYANIYFSTAENIQK